MEKLSARYLTAGIASRIAVLIGREIRRLEREPAPELGNLCLLDHLTIPPPPDTRDTSTNPQQPPPKEKKATP